MSGATDQRTRVIDDPDDSMVTVADEVVVPSSRGEKDVPQAIGRYVIIERLGAGGMGVVYRAFDSKLRREVALKIVRPDGSFKGDEARARLLREAQSLAQLSHRNVVAVYDAEATDHGVCLAMEYIEGRTLKQWLAEGAMDWRDVVDVGRGIALGLAAAHAAELVHRDVKPDNVMIAKGSSRSSLRDLVRVTDFGLARLRDGADTFSGEPSGSMASSNEELILETADLTRTGTAMGTPAYMAPEQHQGRPPDAKADQFALCVLLWEALYGMRPYPGKTFVEIARAKHAGPPSRPHRGVPPWVHRIVVKGLAVSPNDRHRSCLDIADALASGQARVRRRRAVFLFGGLGLFAAGIGVWQELERDRQREACEAVGQSIAEVWNEDAARTMEQELRVSGLSFAEQTYAKAVPWIEAWTAQWAEARTQTCVAAKVDESLSPDLYARSEACLQDRRAELEGLLEVLHDGVPGDVSRVVPAVSGLAGIEECSDLVQLQRRAVLPEDPNQRERIEALRLELRRVRGAGAAGDFDKVLERAKGLQESARAEGYAPLSARAALLVGKLHANGGDLAEAEAGLREAFVEATAAGDDELAAKAASQLALEVGYRGARFEEGLVWITTAEALVRRIEQSDGPLGAEVLTHRGIILAQLGRIDAAVEAEEKSIAIRERVLGRDHPVVAGSLNNLANAYSHLRQPERAREMLERALDIEVSAYGPDHPEVALALSNLGNLASDTGDLERAEELLSRSLHIREAVSGPNHPAVAHALTNLGLVLHQRGERSAAREYYERALAILEAKHGPEHLDVAVILNNLANVRGEQGELDEADALFERVMTIELAHFPANDRRIAETHTNHGAMFFERGAPQRAVEPLREALRIFELDLARNRPDVTQVLASLASVYLALDERELARPLVRRSQKLYDALTPPERGAIPPEFAEELAALTAKLTEPAAPRPLAPRRPGSAAPPVDR